MRDWPELRTFRGPDIERVVMPLGGIGTGTVGLGGRGDLRDWELTGRPAKGFSPARSFFAVRTSDPDGGMWAAVLEGPLGTDGRDGDSGSTSAHAGLPRFSVAEFAAAYPLARVRLTDPAAPVQVDLRAFNPLVPGDAEASGTPVASLRYRVRNVTDRALRVTVVGSVENIVGRDGIAVPDDDARVQREQRRVAGDHANGVLLSATGLPPRSTTDGTIALATPAGDDGSTLVGHRTGWRPRRWNEGLLDFWGDLLENGEVRTPEGATDPVGSLSVTRTVEAGQEAEFAFLLAWHFPHRYGWQGPGHGTDSAPDGHVGNHYTSGFRDAWEVVETVSAALPDLERRTVEFVDTLIGGDVPATIVEAALSSVSVLRSTTCFRTSAGHLHGWEGSFDSAGSCHGSCTHVWNYEQVTGSLFGELARSMREVDFLHATDDVGLMRFRSSLPLDAPDPVPVAAADGQMGTLVRLYREWRQHGDDDWLRRLWPAARRSLEFAWTPGGWDADRDGVMEGTQHNTMDIEYHGPNPEVGGWYLAALAACAVMARHLGEPDFADLCDDLRRRGGAWIDAHLFTGKYYRQQIRPPGEAFIADGLRLPGVGSDDLQRPDFQLGNGCLIDQTIGQVAADLVGLGDLLDRGNQHRALRSILRHNERTSSASVAPAYRTYAAADEPGLVLASYPHGDRPSRPFPYFSEVWTGMEHAVATALVRAGMRDEALQVVSDVRARYDGRSRNPFDEIECGHHYVRSMAAWGTLLAWSDVRHDAVDRTLYLGADASAGVRFLSTGAGYGTVTIEGDRVTVVMHEGSVVLDRIVAADGRRWELDSGTVSPGVPLRTPVHSPR